MVGGLNSIKLIDFTPITFNPNAEASIVAFSFALWIDCVINEFVIAFCFLSDKVKSILLILLAPADIAVSIHFDVLLMALLSIITELPAVNPVKIPLLDSE